MTKQHDQELGVDIQNTWAMSHTPTSLEEYNSLEELTHGEVVCLLVMAGAAFNRFVHYQVLVECWQKLKLGRQRRAYQAEFTQPERNRIARFYGRFYRWQVVTGTPQRVAIRPHTLHLLQRAIEFCVRINDRDFQEDRHGQI